MIVCPQMSWAQVGIDVDTARIVKPQHAEVIGGLTGASGKWALSTKGRLGIADRLDAHVSLSGIYLEDNVGFEYAMGARYGIFGIGKTPTST